MSCLVQSDCVKHGSFTHELNDLTMCPMCCDEMTAAQTIGFLKLVSSYTILKDRIPEMWEYMDFCNGELRVMAGRYGGGWICMGCAVIEWDFDEQWLDLVGGDNDYFEARDYFEAHADIVLIEHAASPHDAIKLCEAELTKTIPEG